MHVVPSSVSCTIQLTVEVLSNIIKRLPQELFEKAQPDEIKGFISGSVHTLTTSL